MKKQSSTSMSPPLLRTSKITPISLSLFRSRVWKDASNDGALRTTRCVALGSRPLLYQIFAIKRSERPKPHRRLLVTRGLHTLDFDTLARLAPGKLQPRLMCPGPEASSLDPTTPDHVAGNPHRTAVNRRRRSSAPSLGGGGHVLSHFHPSVMLQFYALFGICI